MTLDYCLICKITLRAIDKVDIQLNTTEHNKNIENFIKESILGSHAKTSLESIYLCQTCYKAINRLEDYLYKVKHIQQDLLRKYLDNEPSKVLDEAEIVSTENLEVIDKQEEFVNDKVFDSMPPQVHVKPEIDKRKSTRKRKVKKKYSDSEEDLVDNDDDVDQCEEKSPRKEKNKSNAFDDDMDLSEMTKYCCELCGKQYEKFNGFRLHMRDHKNENQFNCKFCSKNFTQKSSLARHMNIHENSFPYKCELCDKRFNHQSSYKIHQQIHMGKRDHICDLCGITFLTKQHLNRHFKTHTKEKNHGCAICGQKFAESYNLKAHLSKVHRIQVGQPTSN